MSQSAARVLLASTHHDPAGQLHAQAARALPALMRQFAGLAIRYSEPTQPRTITLLERAGAVCRSEPPAPLAQLGRSRRAAIALAHELGAEWVLFCDFDRALHWVECYPHELAQVVALIPQSDFTVLGRTARAFASHPDTQRTTEAIINQVFAAVSGLPWDITAAARGLSREALATILEDCPEQSIGTDAAWPLCIATHGLRLGYIATEGLEFETADRFGDAIAAAGGLDAWLALLDSDPQQWSVRLELARLEVEAMRPYQRASG